MEDSAVDVVRRFGGCARVRDLLPFTSRGALQSAIARGELVRLTRGIYALPEAPDSIKAARAVHGVISHQSAAAYWLMEMLFPNQDAHVTVPRYAHPVRPKGTVLHFADLDDEVVTSPVRTVLDCARSMPFLESLAIADSACRRQLVDADELVSAAERLQGAGRQRVLRVARQANARAANPFESAMRAIVIEAGITGFIPQLIIPGTNERIRVDLGDPERKIAMEADSFAFHGTRSALERDCRRYNELVGLGWLVLRFAWEHVMFDQAWCREMMLAACALREAPRIRAGRTRKK